jgi:hypothetical protein
MKGFQRSLRRAGVRQSNVAPSLHRYRQRALSVAVTDPGSANAPFTAVVGDFPEGNIVFLAGIGYFTLTRVSTGLAATFAGNISLGSAPTADATLNGAEVDLLPSTALQAAVAGVSTGNRLASSTAAVLDNTDGSLEINLNGFIADASISATDAFLLDANFALLYAVVMDD